MPRNADSLGLRSDVTPVPIPFSLQGLALIVSREASDCSSTVFCSDERRSTRECDARILPSASSQVVRSLEVAMEKTLALAQEYAPASCRRPESLIELPSIVLSDTACAKATLSLVLGMGVVCMASVIKLPQMMSVISAQSGDGLSIVTLLVETFGYIYNLSAHYRMGYPVSTYGDFAVLALQNFILIMLVQRFAGKPSTGVATVSAMVFGVGLMCSSAFPVGILKALTLANLPVTFAARIPQIAKSYKNKSTGSLSIVTCCGMFLGSCARVFTTLQDVDSVNILMGYLASASLNGVVAGQVLYYGDARRKAIADSKKAM